MKMSCSKLMVVGLMLGSLVGGSAFGAGFQLYNEGSAEAVGLAGAISARRDMVSNAWYNPASVTDFKESRLMLGVTAVNLRGDYCSNVGGPTAVGGDYDATLENKWNAVPSFFYIHPTSERLTLSLAFNMPYGLATSWDWQNNAIGPRVSEMISLKPLFFSPAISYAVNEKLSVAAGLNIVYASAMLRQYLPAPLSRDMKLEADAWGYGYMFGGNYKMNEEWTVAVKYQSPVVLKLMGEANYLPSDPFTVGANKGAETAITLPQTVTLGIANKSIEKWTFGADVLWTNWSQYDKLAFTFEDSPTALGAAPAMLGSQKKWNDVFSYRMSAEYEMSEAWKLRFGYEYDDSPVPDTTRSPDMPDSDRHVFALGLAYDRERWGVDFSYSIAMFEASDANAKGTDLKIPAGAAQADKLNGDYRNILAHLVAVAYRYKF